MWRGRPRPRALALDGARGSKLIAMTAPDINALFAASLVGDYEDDAPWEPVRTLRQIASREVFNLAAEWCDSKDPLTRARGIDVLAQLGTTLDHPTSSFPEESYSIVSRLVSHEGDIQPLDSGISALGHLSNPLAIPLITNYCGHPNADVRFSVACALGSFANDPRSVQSLLLLMEDADEDVRDWATFGLGNQGDCDSNEIREALLRRLSDSNEHVRQEAMAGLAKRRDQRVLRCLLETLDNPPVSECVIEAAYQMLGMEKNGAGWDPEDYAIALRERFGI